MRARLERLAFGPSLAFASLSGLILALGAPPAGWLAGHWLGYLPLILMARRTAIDGWRAALLGLAGGMGVGLGGFPWIAEMLVRFARVPWLVGWLGLALFSAWMAIPYAIWAVGLRFGPFDGWRALAWPVALFVALQSIWPVLFPYTPLLGFAEAPEWMQLAELGGVHLLEALVVLTALLLASALTAERARSRWSRLAAAALIPSAMFVYGGLRMAALDRRAADAPTLRVGIVQPNTPVGDVDPGLKLFRLREPSARLERLGADLVVWPEAGAYPYGIPRPLRHDEELHGARVMSRHRVPTIFGVNTRVPGDRFGYNTVYHLDRRGAVVGSYDKVNLVPIGESIPIIDPDWITDWIPQIGHHHAGEGPARFELEATREGEPQRVPLGPLICYEDIIPAFVREVARQPGGVELFVNLTIDAWYGDSAEPWEHLALAQFRSVEHRIPMVRSVSTGVSAVIDHNGRLVAHVPLRPVSEQNLDRYPAEWLLERVALPTNSARAPTPYARGGWLFPHLCQLVVAVAVGGAWIRVRSRSPARGGAEGDTSGDS